MSLTDAIGSGESPTALSDTSALHWDTVYECGCRAALVPRVSLVGTYICTLWPPVIDRTVNLLLAQQQTEAEFEIGPVESWSRG